MLGGAEKLTNSYPPGWASRSSRRSSNGLAAVVCSERGRPGWDDKIVASRSFAL